MMERQELKEQAIHGDKNFPISVYCNVRNEEQVLSYHWHDEAELIYLKTGDVTFYVDAVPVVLHPGEAAFVRSGQVHGGKMPAHSHCEFHSIVFSPRILLSDTIGSSFEHYIAPLMDNRASLPQKFTNDEYGDSVISKISRIVDLFTDRPEGFEIAVLSCLYEIVFLSAAHQKFVPVKEGRSNSEQVRIERFKQVLDYIHGNFDKKITIGEMAGQIHMSPYYFCRFFKSLSGKTPMEYLNGYRITKASFLLRQTEDRVTDIALDVGFPNFSYFIKQFRNAKGCTPTAYRAQHRQ